MGFFNKPFKATKAFISNPVKIINNDVDKMLGHKKNPTQEDIKREEECFKLHLDNSYNPADRKQTAKRVNDIVGYAHCNRYK
jgi:hypothetical protein